MRIKASIKEIQFFSAFSILYVINAIDSDLNYSISKAGLILVAIIILFKVIYSKYSPKQLLMVFIYMIISLLVWRHSRTTSLLMFAAMLITMEGINYNKVLKFFLICCCVQSFLRFSLSLIGIINNNVIIIYRMIGGTSIRMALGYNHPNQTHLAFFTCICLACYKKTIKLFKGFCLIGINIILYTFTSSRTGLLLTTFVIILFMMKKYIGKIKHLLYFIPLICGLFSIISIILYDRGNPVWNFLNNLLQGRLSNAEYYVGKKNITLFGEKIISDGSGLIIDNAYVIILFSMGILIFCGYIFFEVILLKWLFYNNLIGEAILLVAYSIYGITEGFLTNICINPTLFLLIAMYYKQFPIAFFNRRQIIKGKRRYANEV